MIRLRHALSFENVLVTLIAFAALAGGTAYAAGHLGKGSVGKKQLKAGSVTTAKLKKNSVTAAKLKKAAISSSKVKDGTIGAAAFDPATSPYSGLVQTVTGSGPVSGEVGINKEILIPLANGTFTQNAGETIFIVGHLRYSTAGKCGAGSKKYLVGYVEYDPPAPGVFLPGHEIAGGFNIDESGAAPGEAVMPVTSFDEGSIPPPATTTTRTLKMGFGGFCEGVGSATVSDVRLDVIGVK